MSAITFASVSKSYGSIRALRDVSFEIARGECVALLGPNGAGKTTALEILLGLRSADEGCARIEGSLACTPQATGFPDALRVRDLLEFAAAHYSHPQPIDAALSAFGLEDYARLRVGGLSGGEQRRVALALAFVGNTDVVILDEPSTGLDAESRRKLWGQLRDGCSSRTTLFTTHYLEEAEALATRIILIDRGVVQFDGTPNEFRMRFGMRRMEYTDVLGVRQTIATNDTDRAVRELVSSGASFHDLVVTQSSFEEIFLALTGVQQ